MASHIEYHDLSRHPEFCDDDFISYLSFSEICHVTGMNIISLDDYLSYREACMANVLIDKMIDKPHDDCEVCRGIDKKVAEFIKRRDRYNKIIINNQTTKKGE
jgi:hypothetical protein